MSPFILIKLKPGWRFDPGDGSLRRGRQRVLPELPPGACIRPALQASAPEGQASGWPAERELARHLHLTLPDEPPLIETLQRVRGWAFVERAELPPLRAVP